MALLCSAGHMSSSGQSLDAGGLSLEPATPPPLYFQAFTPIASCRRSHQDSHFSERTVKAGGVLRSLARVTGLPSTRDGF